MPNKTASPESPRGSGFRPRFVGMQPPGLASLPERLIERYIDTEERESTMTTMFNTLQQAYARRGVALEELRHRVSELEVENASLRNHLDADHRQLQSLVGVTGVIDHHRQIAADDGPEVVYDWSQDEDAVEYNLPGA